MLQSVPQKEDGRGTFLQLLGTGRRAGSQYTSPFVQYPGPWGRYALPVLLGMRSHGCAAQQKFRGQRFMGPRRPLPWTAPCFTIDGHRKLSLF